MTLQAMKKRTALVLVVVLAVILGDLISDAAVAILNDTLPWRARILVLAVIIIVLLFTLHYLLEKRDAGKK